MKKIISLGLLLFLALGISSPRLQQMVLCQTRPAGDNSNACATTAFVAGAIGSSITGVAGNLPIYASGGSGLVDSTVAVSSLAPKASPGFTGIPTAPTATAGTNTTQLATTAFTTGGINTLSASVASTYLTQANAASTYLTQVNAASTYAPLASPALTGAPTAPTQTVGDNSSKIATDAFVLANQASGSTRASVRQTVAGGPSTGTPSAPNWLAATSASLTPTAQNVSSTTPLTITGAMGFNPSGPLDYVSQFTSNPTLAACTASTTCYLFENPQTNAFSTMPNVPIYQYGGTIAVTNGQFTFDYQAMIGYLGNGTTAPATPLVALGECTAGATTLSGCIAYAYNGYYDSGYTATLPGVGVQIGGASGYPHNIGVAGAIATIQIINTITNVGYAVGDVVTPYTQYTSAQATPFNTWTQRNAGGSVTGSANAWVAGSKSGGVGTALTAADWSYKMIFRRGWGGA